MGKVFDVQCPSCSAPIKYNAKTKIFKCDYCGTEFKSSDLKKVKDTKLEEEMDTSEYVTYNCPDCGAEIIADSETSATFCVYCGNTAILKNKLSGRFKPDYIIPFKKTKEEAIAAFQNVKKGKPLTPKEFSDSKNIEKIRGLYVPFWLFDIKVDGDLEATGNHVTSWTVGRTVYTKTDTYKFNSSGNMCFTKIPCDGSTRFNDDIMNSIEPFNYQELEEFNAAYLSGFLAEKYDVESDVSFQDVASRSLKSSESKMLADMEGAFAKRVTNNNLKVLKQDLKYALLPVWMVNVKYKDKYYLFAMNGETGKFVGNVPVDKKKAFLIGICVFIGTILLVILISYLIYNIGGSK